MSLELQSCLSCNCGPVSVVDSDTIAYMAANSIVFWNISYNRKDYIWHNALGITTCAASHRSGFIAIGQEGSNPSVAVYSWPAKRLIRTLQAGANIMYTALSFSRTGKYLITVADYPDFTLKVWKDFVQILSVKLEKEPMKIIAHEKMIILFKHEIRTLILNTAFDLPVSPQDDLIETCRYSMKSYSLGEIIPLDACWDKYGNIYLSTNAGELLVLRNDLKDALVLQRFDFNILSMTYTHRYLIIATSQNKIQWVNVFIPPGEVDPRFGKNLNLKPHKELVLEDPQDIIQLLYSGDMQKLILVGAEGKLQVLYIPADPSFETEDDLQHDQNEDLEQNEQEDDQSLRKPKAVLATPQVLGQFHIGCVREVVALGDTTQCVSIAQDLRIWEVITGENLTQYQPIQGIQFTSLDANQTGSIIAVGSSGGAVRFFDVSNRLVPRILSITRLLDSEIDTLKYSPDQRLVACSSSYSNKIFFLEGTVQSKFREIGCVEYQANIRTFTWHKKAVAVILDNNVVAYHQSPRPDQISQIEPLSLLTRYRYVAQGYSIGIFNNKIYLAGAGKQLFIYNLPEQDYDSINFKKLPHEPIDKVPVHTITTSILAVSPDLRLLAVGCYDGTIKVIQTQTFDYSQKQIHGSSGVQNISFSKDSQLLFTTGQQRDFFSWSLSGRPFEKPVTNEGVQSQLDALESVDDIQDVQVRFFFDILAETRANSEAEQIGKVKQRLTGRLDDIKQKLKVMLDANQKAPQLEKLDRDQFVLDIQAKLKIEKQGQELAEKVREQARERNLEQELLKERIVLKTLKGMDVNSRVISSMVSDQIVHNYTIRKLSNQETTFYKKIRAFRLTELRESQQRKEHKIPEIIQYEDFQVEWIIGKSPDDWINHPLLSELLKKRISGLRQGDSMPVPQWELIYPAPLVYTPSRKRLQIYLLHLLVRALKEGFNVEFEKLQDLKGKQADAIDEKNAMIIQKQKELSMAEKVFKAPKHQLEEPQKILMVNEAEILVQKYLTKQERDALQEKRLKEQERIRLLNADDSKKKALMQMMYGTIQNKKNTYSMLTEQLEREEWMDTLTLQEMTEEQRQRFKQFEEKEKKLQEDKDKLRKILEGELKKLQGEVFEICRIFDNKIKELFLLRLNTDYEIYRTELMIAKLTLSLLQQDKRNRQVEQLRLQKAKWLSVVQKKQDEITEFGHHIQQLQQKIKRAQQDAKNVQINFIKNTLDKEVPTGSDQTKLKNLLRLGPDRRGMTMKTQPPAELAGLLDNLNPLDPFSQIQKEIIVNSIPPPPPKQIEQKDIPPGIPPLIVQKLINDRRKKLNYQRPIPNLQSQIRQVQKYKKWLELKSHRAQQHLKKISHQLREKEAECHKQLYNTQLLLTLKQAIVQVPQQPVVTDYSDAILVNREVVEQNNKEIRNIGNSKVDILRQIAKFKIDLAKVKWREELLQFQTDDYVTSEGDLKMLRIDKRLQNILAGRGLDQNQQMAERIRKQIEHLNMNTEKRVNQIHEKLGTLTKSIQELTQDNQVLENEVYDMEKKEEERDQLLKLRATVSDQAVADPAGKFKHIATRRKMMDTIEQYREEIEFLNDELDRLRAKTFPSFAHLQAHVDYPDEFQQMDSLDSVLGALKRPFGGRSEGHLKVLMSLVKGIPFFKGLDTSISNYEYRECCQSLSYLKKETGQYVVRYGERASQFFVLVKGKVAVLVPKDKEWKQVARLEDGACFGDYGLNEHKPRSASIVCLEECHFAILDRLNYQRLLQKVIQIQQRQKIELLKKHSLFAPLSTSILLKLVYFFNQMQIGYGKMVVQQKEKTEFVYFVKLGEFKIFRWMECQDGIKLDKKGVLLQKKKKVQVQIAIATTGTLIGEDDIQSQSYSSNCMCVSKEGVLLAIKISELLQRVNKNNSYGLIEKIRLKRHQRESQYKKKLEIRNLYWNQPMTPVKFSQNQRKRKFKPLQRFPSKPKFRNKLKEKLNTNIKRTWSDCVLNLYRMYSQQSPSVLERNTLAMKRARTPKIRRRDYQRSPQQRKSSVSLHRHF